MSATDVRPPELHRILVTDVGSTTSKARFFKKTNGEWRYFVSGEAPTTVEFPYEDVTKGVKNAIREIEDLTGHQIMSGDSIIVPFVNEKGIEKGVDVYCSTSSAGGGLQMMVAGVMKNMTAESANRAALGAGAIVMEVISLDDGRAPYEKIQRLRTLRPDMILVAGGTDGGTVKHVLQIAELISNADPRPRLGINFKLPLVYAGNKDASTRIKNLFGNNFALIVVDNLRPTMELENTTPARNAIHELFMEHVMSHAPGYDKLMKWTHIGIMPTPAAEGMAMQLIADTFKMNTIGVGLGGATTNVYSIMDGRFVRSVSANLGMSYSICNVMKEAGAKNIVRWLPWSMSKKEITNRIINKMIRPTTIPQTLEDLVLEHAVAREALRLGLEHHKTIATGLKGALVKRTIADMITPEDERTYIKMMKTGIIAGTGGLLSHAPRRVQTMIILADAFQPEGVTRLFQDSVFMMPHLGVLSTVSREAAWNIFDKDCLVRLGTIIAPVGAGKIGDPVMTIEIEMPDGRRIKEEMSFGEIKRIQLAERQEAKAVILPHKAFDVGHGPGRKTETKIMGGVVGIMLDARGRPIHLPEDESVRKETLLKWFKSVDLYAENKLKDIV